MPESKQQDEKQPSEAQIKKAEEGASKNVPASIPEEFKRLAENYPEGDAVLKAYKDGLTADSPQEEAEAYARASKESPRASETPSGYALEKVASHGHDTERGEKYARAKASRRWGYDEEVK